MAKVTLMILISMTSLSPLKFSDAGKCPNLWTAFGSSCYKFIQERTSWFDAHVICKIADSQMIQIDSKDEDVFAVQLARSHGLSIWIGVSDLVQEGHFLLDDSLQYPSYTHFGPGQPDNYKGREDCVVLWDRIQYFWNDAECELKWATICEKHAKN